MAAELALHRTDVYGGVAAINFADLTWRFSLTADFSQLCPATSPDQLIDLS